MLFFWLGFILIGALTGSIRQILLLVAIVASAILSGSLYEYAAVAGVTVIGMGYTQPVMEGYMLLLLFLVLLLALYGTMSLSWKETRPVSRRARGYDSLLGALLGVASGLLFVVVMYAGLWFATANRWPNLDATRITLQDQVRNSVLQPVLETRLPVAYIVLRPFLPRGIPGFPVR
jgi:hypothetical protein